MSCSRASPDAVLLKSAQILSSSSGTPAGEVPGCGARRTPALPFGPLTALPPTGRLALGGATRVVLLRATSFLAGSFRSARPVRAREAWPEAAALGWFVLGEGCLAMCLRLGGGSTGTHRTAYALKHACSAGGWPASCGPEAPGPHGSRPLPPGGAWRTNAEACAGRVASRPAPFRGSAPAGPERRAAPAACAGG